MVGVASPMLRRSPEATFRFLGGLIVGFLAAGVALGLSLGMVAEGLALVPDGPKVAMSVVVLGAFAFADLIGRPPQYWRQVPQRFIHTLSPGIRGAAWGVDLGLLVTTQKATSLLWAALAGAALWNGPSGVLEAIAIGAIVFLSGLIMSIIISGSRKSLGDTDEQWSVHWRRTRAGQYISSFVIFGSLVNVILGASL